jgi:hypothetical protein
LDQLPYGSIIYFHPHPEFIPRIDLYHSRPIYHSFINYA